MDRKILIIDDSDQDRKGMAVALERNGYCNFSFADSAQTGFEMIQTLKPDVILIDVVLQDTDGFDLCVQIRALKDIQPKIIMITGHLDAVNAHKARVSGADEIIEKIAGFSNIGRTIREIG